MYLKDLMQGEKYAFYSIVKHLVSIDGEFSPEEKNLLDKFLEEMQISMDEIPSISHKDAIDMFTFSSASTRRKVYIELIGVTLCDEYLHCDEKKYLDNIANTFLISEDLKEEMFDAINDLLKLYKKMNSLVELP